MSAVSAPRPDYPDRHPVPYVENKQMNDPAPETRENILILNIQKDVTDLRAEVRAINGRIDSFGNRVDARFEKVDARFEKAEQRREEDKKAIDARFDKVDQQRHEDRKAIDARFEKVDACFAEMRKETKADFTAMTNRIDGTYRWVLGLFFAGLGALATLVGLIGHGFKWF
jgi:hypothetical protein